MTMFKVGDFVKGLPSSDDKYSYTNSKMTKAEVISVDPGGCGDPETIKVRILEHTKFEEEVGSVWDVDPKYFTLWTPTTDEAKAVEVEEQFLILGYNTDDGEWKLEDYPEVYESLERAKELVKYWLDDSDEDDEQYLIVKVVKHFTRKTETVESDTFEL